MITSEHVDVIGREAQKADALRLVHEVSKEILATQNNMKELELQRDSLKSSIVALQAEADKQTAEYEKSHAARESEYKSRMEKLDYDYEQHRSAKEAELMSIQSAYNDEQAKLSATRAQYEKEQNELKSQVEEVRSELNGLKYDLESLKSKHGIK